MTPDPVLAISMRRQSVNDQEVNDYERPERDSHAVVRKHNILCKAGWFWNKNDRSKEATIHGNDNGTRVTFHPQCSNGTAGIRASEPLIGAFNYWEIHVGGKLFGTSLMFGVSTKQARLHVNEFVNLLGEDAYGWGLSHRGWLYHNGEAVNYCRPFQENTPVVVGVLVDLAKGEITFFKDGVNLGVAFKGLNKVGDDLYPTICCTAAKTAMVIGLRQRSFTDLQDRCRQVIASSIVQSSSQTGNEKDCVSILPLPTTIKHFICYGLDGLRTDGNLVH